jgi:hypothetical protein
VGASCLGFISIIVVFVTIAVSWVVVVRDLWHWRRRRREGTRGFEVVDPRRPPPPT